MAVNVASKKTIKAFAAKKEKGKLESTTYEAAPLGENDVKVKITHCGVCHSDLHLINNDWGISKYPMIPGHEIIGTVIEKGKNATEFQVGQRVGIGWQRGSCHHCEWCFQGEENLCLTQEATCVGHPGGFADQIVVDQNFVFPIPDTLSSENAAPLLCGGITTFSPYLNLKVDATWKVGVIGIGGLGHLALQFGKAFGCEMFAFSTTPEKEKEAKGFGATHFILSREKEKLKAIANTLDLILFTASEATDYTAFLDALKPKGILCLIGAPKEGHIDLPIFNLIAGRKAVAGSNIGSPFMIRKMLELAARHGIKAKVELFPMSEVNQALEKVAKNQVHYRAVLTN